MFLEFSRVSKFQSKKMQGFFGNGFVCSFQEALNMRQSERLAGVSAVFFRLSFMRRFMLEKGCSYFVLQEAFNLNKF
jgi:hypothetical protein